MDHECLCEKQADADDFTSEQWNLIDKVIEKYRDKPWALIPVLEEIQCIGRRVGIGHGHRIYRIGFKPLLQAKAGGEFKKESLNRKLLLL